MALPTLKQQVLADMDLLFDDPMPWQEDCVYTPVGGSAVTIPCHLSGDIDTFSNMEQYVGRGEDNAEFYIWVKKADVPSPQWRDKFTIRGVDYFFGYMGVVKSDPYSSKINLRRDYDCED